MDRLRVLVLGLGYFGKRWLGELAACASCEVAGIVAKHPELRAAAGDEFRIPAAIRSVETTRRVAVGPLVEEALR
jgi:predicted dehydrogenase